MAVYLIRHPGDKAVKIGFTDGDPEARLRSLQTGSASLLELVAVIPDAPIGVERELHRRFAGARLRTNGEWFEDSVEIQEAFVDHQAASHRVHLEQRIRQAVDSLTISDKTTISELERSILAARQWLDANGCGCAAVAPDRELESHELVRAFWAEFRTEFAWDLLPLTFLYDMYKAWFVMKDLQAPVCNVRLFNKELVAALDGDNQWVCKDPRRSIRPGDSMSASEPLIELYDLIGWMNRAQPVGSPLRYTPICRTNYRGVERRVRRIAVAPSVGRFIAECCDDDCPENDGYGTKALHADYRRFCRANGVVDAHQLGEREFATRLSELGYVQARSSGRRFWRGLKILPSDMEARVAQSQQQVVQRPRHREPVHDSEFMDNDSMRNLTIPTTGPQQLNNKE